MCDIKSFGVPYTAGISPWNKTKGHSYFLPPITTYSYSIELINGGNADFTFKSLIIKEVSKEEFDEDQKRIEKLKKIASKGQKKRRKNKKSK